jgi:hypothetical protein
MKEAINAYHQITAESEFRELERLRSYARHNEATALRHARTQGREEGRAEGEAKEREKWQNVAAAKDAEIARLREQLEKK